MNYCKRLTDRLSVCGMHISFAATAETVRIAWLAASNNTANSFWGVYQEIEEAWRSQ